VIGDVEQFDRRSLRISAPRAADKGGESEGEGRDGGVSALDHGRTPWAGSGPDRRSPIISIKLVGFQAQKIFSSSQRGFARPESPRTAGDRARRQWCAPPVSAGLLRVRGRTRGGFRTAPR